MKVLVDTNIILDVLCNRLEFVEASSKVWKLCELDIIDGFISALSVTNIVYILRKELTPQKTQEMINIIALIFKIVDLKAVDLKNASDMYSSDFEDAVQISQANRIGADYIIARNIRDFKESKVSAVKPVDFLKII